MPVGSAGIPSCRQLLLAAMIACACALALPLTARAELLTVDTSADEADAAIGSGGCATAAGKCSLRAAIEESNFSVGEYDEVAFDEEAFDGTTAAAIHLASGLPPLTDAARINGRECETELELRGPCVEVEGVPAEPALVVEGAAETELEGLAIVGAEIGVAAAESPRLKVRGSWIGVELDGTAAGNGIGVLLEAGSDSSRIGGEGPEAGNLIAGSSGAGVALLGVSGVRVLGNRLGVDAAGTAAAANGTDVLVASTAGSDAVGNSIGTRVTPVAAASPACDGGCNLVSGSASAGIDLGGDGAGLLPAIATTVAGNKIGFDQSGLAVIPNAGAGVLVGSAPQTLIGGTKPESANAFAGGTTAVSATGAPNLVVRGNLVGAGPTGGDVAPPADAIVVDSEGLASGAVEALIADNRIDLAGGAGISQQGFGAWITGNAISGATNGIRLHGPDEGQGNLVEGNRIEATEAAGILIENDANQVYGNVITGAGGAGIEIQGPPPFGASENVIGGGSAAEENEIDGATGAAIGITNVEGTENEVGRNRGTANLGPFIDLKAVSPGTEPIGPNGGVLPPSLSATETAVGGLAEPGALVRVFRKQGTLPGELASYVGLAIADEEGNWALQLSAPLPPGAILAATQTNTLGGTSELAVASVPGSGNGGSGGAPPVALDTRAPQTRITKHPRPRSRRASATFRFKADESGAHFLCSLDGGAYRPCRSPKRYGNLQPGPHVFRVRAVDTAGNADPQPARWRFIVRG
ncbi:MAG TPA: right-handed parallel beta-helix repeat-containing protein [Solirubrobacterales bacterium]|nr:right-handed parallel beta-helix repeat-containing protein [Solirubrobacterales bacterium]